MDDQGNWIPDATLTSTDGSNTYSYTNVQPVPEPSALLFCFVAVFGTVLWRFRPCLKAAR